jgi:hypothetical protein
MDRKAGHPMSKHWEQRLHPRDRHGLFSHGSGGGQITVHTRDQHGSHVKEHSDDGMQTWGPKEHAAHKAEVTSRITELEKRRASLDRNYAPATQNPQQKQLRAKYAEEIDALKEYSKLVFERPPGKPPTPAEQQRIVDIMRRYIDRSH